MKKHSPFYILTTFMLVLAILLSACGIIDLPESTATVDSTPAPEATPRLVLFAGYKQLDEYELTMKAGDDLILSATVFDLDGDTADYVWECSDVETLKPEISSDGQVCRLHSNRWMSADRTATVTVSCGDLSQTVTIKVSAVGGGEDMVATVEVDSLMELLNSISSNTRILLKPGVYNLTDAPDYGKELEGAYTWQESYDGSGLVISGVTNLTIGAADGGDVVIETTPRTVSVLTFQDCVNVSLENLYIGHTEMAAACEGEVVKLLDCSGARISGCHLYGCGTCGVFASNTPDVSVTDSEIYDCSSEGIYANNCDDLLVAGCEIHDCGLRGFSGAFSMISLMYCANARITDCTVYNNHSYGIIRTFEASTAIFRNCEFRDNVSDFSFFSISFGVPRFENCEFTNNRGSYFQGSDSTFVYDENGDSITEETLGGVLPTYEVPAELAVEDIPTVEGKSVHVKTADEFLAAIAPDTNIYLDAELFDLTAAAGYGVDGEYYFWDEVYDGMTLVINKVDNLCIIGLGRNETTIQTSPRYADVISFRKCDNVTVAKLTAGHSPEPAACSGNVLSFLSCDDFRVYDCGLFGCGVFGISTEYSDGGDIRNTEIYECSGGAALLMASDEIVFTDCLVRDCNHGSSNLINLSGCKDCVYNGISLPDDGLEFVG